MKILSLLTLLFLMMFVISSQELKKKHHHHRRYNRLSYREQKEAQEARADKLFWSTVEDWKVKPWKPSKKSAKITVDFVKRSTY